MENRVRERDEERDGLGGSGWVTGGTMAVVACRGGGGWWDLAPLWQFFHLVMFLKISIGGFCRGFEEKNFALCLKRFGEEMKKIWGLEVSKMWGTVREREEKSGLNLEREKSHIYKHGWQVSQRALLRASEGEVHECAFQRRKGARSRHQRLFVENVGKTEGNRSKWKF